jgi:peptide/nickel transport system substrate-binding protein
MTLDSRPAGTDDSKTSVISRRQVLKLTGVLGAGAVAGLAGCSEDDEESGDLVIGTSTGPTSMDPQSNTDTPSRDIWIHFYDSLIGRNQDLELVPQLATDWEQVDSTTWEFTLREDVTFSNDEVFNAETVKFNFDRLSGQMEETGVGGPIRGWYENVESAEVVDEYTVHINLTAPDPSFLTRQTVTWMIPREFVEENGFETLATEPVGTGPYVLEDWVRDEEVVMEARSDYFDGAPPIETLVWEPTPESTSRLTKLETGDAGLIKDVNPQDVSRVEGTDGIGIQSEPVVATAMIYLNMKQDVPGRDEPLFYDRPELRRAFNYAVDMDAIIDTILDGNAERIQGWALTDAFLGYNSDIDPYPHDPEQAQQLMNEAGFEDGYSATLTIPSGRYLRGESIVEAMASQLAEINVDIEINPVEFGRFIDITLEEQHQESFLAVYTNSSLSTLDAYNLAVNPASPNSLLPTEGQPDWVENVVANIEEAGSASDLDRADELLRETERLLHDNAAFGYMFRYSGIWGKDDELDWQPRQDNIMDCYTATWE